MHYRTLVWGMGWGEGRCDVTYLVDLVIVVGIALAVTARVGIIIVLAVAVLALAVVACESA